MKYYLILILIFLTLPIYASGIVIDFDSTVFVQFFIFIVFGFLIQTIIVKPVVEILDKRENATIGTKEEVLLIHQKIIKMEEEYNEKILNAKKESQKNLEAKLVEVQAKTQKMFEESKTKTEKNFSEFKEKLQKEQKALQSNVAKESKDIAQMIVKKIMG